jgi:hypothetical protein
MSDTALTSRFRDALELTQQKSRANWSTWSLVCPDIPQGLTTYLDEEFRSLQRRKSKEFLGQVRMSNVPQFSSKWPIISMFMRENSSSETLKQ